MKFDAQPPEGGRRPVQAYGLALIAAMAGVGLHFALEPLLGDRLPFLSSFLAVLLVARYCGRGPALFALCISAVAVTWFVTEPRNSFRIDALEQRIGLVLHVVVGWIAIGLFSALDQLRRSAESDRARLSREVAARQAAEQELSRRQQLLQTTFDSLGDAVITTDASGSVASLNAVAERMTGWTSPQAQRQPLSDVFQVLNEHDRQPVAAPTESALRSGAVVNLAGSSLLIGRDGAEHCIDGSVAPIRSGDGTVLGCVLLFRDVTDLRRAQELRDDVEGRIRSVVNHVVDGIITIDEHGRIESFNPAAERLFGYRGAEVIGSNVKRLMPEPYHSRHDQYIADYLRTGEARIIGLGREVAGRRKDGSTFPMDLAVSEFTHEGRRYFTGIVRDITERKRSEAALFASEERLRGFMDNIPAMAWLKDDSGRYLLGSASFVAPFGLTQEDIVGRTDHELFPSHIADDYRRNDLQVLASGKPAEFTEVTEEPDGEHSHLVVKFPVRDAYGRQCVGGVAIDVTRQKAAEAQAQAEADRVQIVADAVPALIAYIDVDCRYRLNNRAYETWFGHPRSELVGRHMRDVLGEAAWSTLRPYVDAALRGEAVVYEAEVPYRDGGARWISATYTPDLAVDGRVRGFVAHVVDISRRKSIEQALGDSDARFRRAADGAQALVYDVDLPADDGHETVAHTYGIEHIVGPESLPAQLTTRWWHKRIHPDDLPRHLEEIRRATEDRACTSYRSRYRVRHSDESWRHVDDAGQIVRDAGGRARRLAGTILDVTDRTLVETALQGSEQRFRNLAETVPSIVWTADPDGRITYINNRWLEYCGITSEANARLWPDVVLHPDDRAQCLQAWRAALRDGTDFQVEVRNRRHDGVYRWFVTKAIPQQDDRGQVTAWFGVTTDIHDQKELQDQLRDADRRKDEFLATLAHELRNPLAPIRAALELLRTDCDEREFEHARSAMERQVAQMVRLIDDLLDVSRITRNKLELRKDRVELAAIVQQAVETCRPLCEQAGHQLHVALPADPIVVHADPVRLAQVFGNLLTNACKYTAGAGHIWLQVQSQADTAEVTVRDNGVGIPPEMLPRVFDMFTQVDRSLDRSDGGLGIGLSLVKRLVELHGGTVDARSEGPGRGAEFSVRLPIERDTSVSRVPPSAKPVPAVHACRILVVDDNFDAAQTLSMLLKVAGHETHVAHDGPDALDLAARVSPDLILLDIGLPKLDGYDVCRAIRAEPWGAGIAIVALTGWGQDSDRRKSTAAGFDAHLVKPVDFTTLNRLIAELGDRRGHDPQPHDGPTRNQELARSPVL